MFPEHGWVTSTTGDNAHLSDEVRSEIERRIEQRRRERGGLLGIVEVRVFERGAEPQVSFPPGALLGPDSGPTAISDVVARARDELAEWR